MELARSIPLAGHYIGEAQDYGPSAAAILLAHIAQGCGLLLQKMRGMHVRKHRGSQNDIIAHHGGAFQENRDGYI